MTISTWLLILTLAAGSGTSESTLSDSSTSSPSAVENGEPVDNCWINGVWYNPCPASESPWAP